LNKKVVKKTRRTYVEWH